MSLLISQHAIWLLTAIQTQLTQAVTSPSLITRKYLCSKRKIFLGCPHPLPNTFAKVYTNAGTLLVATPVSVPSLGGKEASAD